MSRLRSNQTGRVPCRRVVIQIQSSSWNLLIETCNLAYRNVARYELRAETFQPGNGFGKYRP